MLKNISPKEDSYSFSLSIKETDPSSSDVCLKCKLNGSDCVNCTINGNIVQHTDKKKRKDNKNPSSTYATSDITTPPKIKKTKPNYISTSHCRYDIIRQIASKFGMRESHENWNILWSDYLVTCEKVKNLRRYQKINHFPGMAEICRKDLLARNLNRMSKLFPKEYEFFPKTWLLPIDLAEVTDYGKKSKNSTYILKPDIGCKGKGIQLTKNLKDLASLDRTICQAYVTKPYLIDGFKFDLRVYVLVTSCDPLRLYVYNEGLVRFATKRYKEPNKTNMTNMYMHLTNYSVNKFSRTYIADPEEGSKRKLSTLNDYLRKQCHDVEQLWDSIDDVIIKTVLLALPTLQHNYKAAFPSHRHRQACFEILGFDLILDNSLKPYLLEVNHSPSFHTDAPIDRDVKEALIIDTFKIMNLPKNIKYSVLLEDKRDVTNRLLKDLQTSPNGPPIPNNGVKQVSSEEQVRKLEIYEKEHIGNFRKIYPNKKLHQYSVFYCQGTSSLFNETFASRARERVSKLMKEGLQECDIANLKPFEPVVSHSTKRQLTQSLVKRQKEMCESVNSHEKVAALCTENEKKGEVGVTEWNNHCDGKNANFLQKVQECARNFRMQQELNEMKQSMNKKKKKKIISKAMEVHNTFKDNRTTFQGESDSCSRGSDCSEFLWDVHFGLNKTQYKIDSFFWNDKRSIR